MLPASPQEIRNPIDRAPTFALSLPELTQWPGELCPDDPLIARKGHEPYGSGLNPEKNEASHQETLALRLAIAGDTEVLH